MVAPLVLAAMAVLHPGAPVSQVDLNDGTVWLTNTTQHRLGRYNPMVEELNAGLVVASDMFDVLQDGMDVLVTEPGKISVVDPASVAFGAQTTIPFGSVVSMAGGTTAVVQPSAGAVWARLTSMIGSLQMDQDDPDLELGAGGSAVVARSGLVLGAEQDGTIHTLRVGAEGAKANEAGRLAGDLSGPIEQVTAVGDEIVVLAGRRVHTPSGTVDLSSFGAELTLQQPGPRSSSVLVATPTALLEVPLSGGTPREHVSGGSGTAAAPVLVGTCAHAAWASPTGSYLGICQGAEPEVLDLAEMSSSSELVFRVNRDVVVLNDVRDGRLWLPTVDAEVREPNWTDIEVRDDQQDVADREQTAVTTETLQPECTPQSAPPTAVDDEYGVRPGRTMILSVIDNDASSSCGILTITENDPIPEEFGTLVLVNGGRALQLVVSPSATGTAEFRYTVADGRGSAAPSTATVRLTVHPDGENGAPVQLRTGAMLVEQGGSATYDLLPDFRDPDGDPLLLVGAVVDGGGTVRTRGDGQVRFQSDGGSLGRQTITATVSDGSASVEGALYVDVRPAGSLPPVIDPVHAVTYVDEPVVLHPLDAVHTTGREPVRLAGVDEVPGLTVESNLDAGTFTVTSPTAGTFYVPFTVTAAPQQAVGLARIDVRERPEAVPPPVAVIDVALLPPGGEVTIDPLANDIDASGQVLVLQSVDVPADSGIRAAVLQHQLVRIDAIRTLEAPVVLRYTISNGSAVASGDIVVQPVPATASQQAPVVPDVQATVRTGGVVTIPVLEGAFDPDGDVLTLARDLAEPPGEGEGLMFVSGDVLRFRAPDSAMEVRATFTVTDPLGNATAASVTVSVHESDPEAKPPPRPLPLTARVYEAATVRITVPLIGIDVDGDGVSLLGVDRAPTKGWISAVGADWLEYQALPGELGTDEFSYAVEDWAGQRAVATVRVGIAPRPATSADVICRPDAVSVRPGETVEVRVLANDVDTGGGELTLDEQLEPAGVDATVDGRRIVVNATTPGVLQIAYTARNSRGGQDSAVLTVTVSEDAPILPPIAEDVVVPAKDTLNATSVEVDVLGKAQNPSGPLSDLAVSVHPSVADVATVTPSGAVVVTLVDHQQTLPYKLTNTDPRAQGVFAYAFITVPALGDFPPMLRPRTEPLSVIAGQPLEINLAEQVQVAPGRTARIADPTGVSATKSDGSPLVVDDDTLRYTARRDYAGPASISVLVSDGSGSDLTAHSAMLTLPITVLAAEDYPPTFSPSVLDVAPDESAHVDLLAFTSAPIGSGEGRYTYELTSAVPAGFEVSLDGSVLTVSAADTVPRGTVAGVTLGIGYGGAGPVEGQVDFRVVASQRQLARVQSIIVPDGVEGGLSTVSVLDGSYNPFPDTPLTVVDAVVETPGAGTASVNGQQVAVRPVSGFIGQLVARFTVRDATGDPNRVVEGRITVTVRGRPAPPSTPRAVTGDRTVLLSWDAPANNGAVITSYRVTDLSGTVGQTCQGTTCEIGGLTNNVAYRFTVTAQNEVGISDPSLPSDEARPDATPSAPAAPTAVRGDGRLEVSWNPPENHGSPITEYQVEISPANEDGQVLFTSGSTSLRASRLRNGQEYRFRVQAENLEGYSGWSELSTPVIPAGLPGQPAPVGQRYGETYGGGWIEVSWPDPDANGVPISEYQVRVNGGAPVAPSGDHRYLIANAGPGRYTVEVRARNEVGWGSWGSVVVDQFTVPAPMSAPRTSSAAGSGEVRLDWTAPDSGGSAITHTQLSVDGGDFRDIGGDWMVRNLVAGLHGFAMRACNNAGCGAASPPVEQEVTTRPGDVRPGSVVLDNPTTPTKVTAQWLAPSDTGGLALIYVYRYRFYRFSQGRGGWSELLTTDALASGPIDIPSEVRRDGGRVEFEVFAQNTVGGWSPNTLPLSADIPVPPPPAVGSG